MTCDSSVVRSRLRPSGASVLANVDETISLAVLHINCTSPNGAVTVSLDSGQTVTLADNGVSPDQVAGDGVYSAGTSFSSYGVHTLTFPGGEVVNVQVLRTYSSRSTAYEYRSFTGTTLDVQLDTSRELATPFPIRFGGGSFDKLHVSPNGIAGVSGPHIDFFNVSMPIASRKAFIAAFWDDLYPTYPTSGNDRRVPRR